MFWQTLGDADLAHLAETCRAALAEGDAVISSLSIYGDVLMDNAQARKTRHNWKRLIDTAPSFGCDLVTGEASGNLTLTQAFLFYCFNNPCS